MPPGYTCSTVDDLLVAFRLLGTHEAVVKPLYGKEGEGVLFVSSPEELRLYGFPLGDVVLESALSLDRGADGIPISISHLTLGQQLVGSYEKVSIGTSKFGFRSTQVHPASRRRACVCLAMRFGRDGDACCSCMLLVQVGSAFEATALAWTHELSKMLAPCGPGYFHYVSHRGQPVLLGLRLGQLSTEHFAMLFLQRHAPGKGRVAQQQQSLHAFSMRRRCDWLLCCAHAATRRRISVLDHQRGQPGRVDVLEPAAGARLRFHTGSSAQQRRQRRWQQRSAERRVAAAVPQRWRHHPACTWQGQGPGGAAQVRLAPRSVC